DRLLDSARRIFAERGYQGTSVREIIEDAGVTRPVLYYYFKNKEALFSHLIKAPFDEACDTLDAILADKGDCRAKLKRWVAYAFDRAQRSPDMVRLLLQFFFSPPVADFALDKEALGQERFVRLVALMEQGLTRGELRGADAETLARAFAGMVDMQVLSLFSDPNSALSPELGDRLVDLFLDGAGPPAMAPAALELFAAAGAGARS
ncbi:MAG: TetR/AcrR family transcriptional regulator, partial [Candidatus Hydrogenedentales bacterium]